MTEELAQAESQNPLENPRKPIGDPKPSVESPKKKKKASWFRTILWMLSMMLLANMVVGVIAYFLFIYKK